MSVPSPNMHDPSAVVDCFRSAAAVLLERPERVGSHVRIPARGRLLATGDLHDNPIHYAACVKAAKLDASPDHHVVLHELIHGDRLINGLDFSHRMLAKVAALVLAYPGQVHPVLANHELSQLTGAGVSKGAGNSVVIFREAIEYAFGDDADEVSDACDAFLAAMPLALIAGTGEPGPPDRPTTVLCAHSLPAAEAMDRFDPAILERPLEAEDRVRPDGSAYLMTWGRTYTDESVERLAEAWGAGMFVLGHMHVASGVEAAGKRVVVLNSDHEMGRIVPLDLTDLPGPTEMPLHALPLASLG